MTDALILATIFGGLASILALPLAVVIGLPMLGWLGRGWLALKEREVELRRLEVAAQLRASHYERLPAYVDVDDPQALLAWARTDRELTSLTD